MDVIKLLKKWKDPTSGKEYGVGQLLRVDKDTAKELIEDGIAESYDPEKEKASIEPIVADADEVVSKFVEKFGDEMEKRWAEERKKARKESKGSPVPDDLHVDVPEIVKDDKWGFKSFAHYCMAIKEMADPSRSTVDERFAKIQAIAKADPTTFGSSLQGEDGGFAIAPEFQAQIRGYMLAEGALLPLCDRINISGNSLVFPADETTPWDTSNGVQVYWKEEGAAATQSKLKLKDRSMRLKTLIALVPMTEELMEDASALDTYLGRKVGEKLSFNVDEQLVAGDGATKPLGVLNSAALVAATRAGSPLAAGDVTDVYGRMIPSSINRSVWLINNSLISDLFQLSLSNQPLYFPPGGFPQAPQGTLFGRPIRITQHAKAAAAQGDIILADLSQYVVLMKAGGIKSAVSMHVWFDFHQTAFKFWLRMNGQPWAQAAVTPQNGSETLSSFVTLAA